MYDAETDTPAMARTSNLNEELGQVHTCTLCTLHYYFVLLRGHLSSLTSRHQRTHFQHV